MRKSACTSIYAFVPLRAFSPRREGWLLDLIDRQGVVRSGFSEIRHIWNSLLTPLKGR